MRFERIHMMPKPLQPGGVPIWVSGTVNPMVARRLAEFGSGWIPWGDAASDPVEGIRRMGELLAAHGRDIREFQVVGTLPIKKASAGFDLPATMAAVPEMHGVGVTDFRVWLRIPSGRSEALDLVAPVVQAFRSAAGRSA